MAYDLTQVSGTTVAFTPPGLSGGEAANSAIPYTYNKQYGFGVKFRYQTTGGITVVASARENAIYVFVSGSATGVNYNGTSYSDGGAGLSAGDTVEYYISSSASGYRIFRSVNGATATQVVNSATIVDSAAGGFTHPIVVRGLHSAPNTYTYPGIVDAVCWDSVPQHTAVYTPSATFNDLYANRVASWQLDGNLTDTAGVTPPAATAITLAGPSSGLVGAASAAFTAGANGVITGTVTVTPSDSGGGGTFTPTSVGISSGTPTATFTYTPGSAGAKSITVTNNGGLTNPSARTYTANSGAVAFTGSVPAQTAPTGSAYTLALASYFSGPQTPYTYSVFSGSLPPGLTLNASTGTISGTPTTGGSYSAVIRATDTGSNTANTNSIAWTINALAADIPADNAAIYYSPAGWLVSGGTAKTINTGQYFRTFFTGASCVLKFNTAGLAAPLPMLLISVDGRPAQRAVLASSVTVMMPSDQSNTKHLLEVMVDSMTETQPRWSTQSTAVVLTGIALAGVGDALSAVETQPTYDIYFGDSITEGVRTLAMNGTADRDRNSAAVNWPVACARALGGEFSVVGFGATGFNAGGSGGVPKLASSWASLWSGQARNFATAPRRAIVMMGTNDTGSVTAEATATLNGMLAAMAGTRIYVLRPFNGAARAADLIAAVAACSAPSRVTYIDTAGFWNPADSSDSLHPYGYTALAQIGPRVAAAIRAAESAAPATTSRTVSVTLTTDGTTPRASVAGVKWAWWDTPSPGSLAAPMAQGNSGSTNASGVFTQSFPTTLAPGGVGWLTVTTSDGTVGQSPMGWQWSGPVAVS